jgi:hypothetical protein
VSGKRIRVRKFNSNDSKNSPIRSSQRYGLRPSQKQRSNLSINASQSSSCQETIGLVSSSEDSFSYLPPSGMPSRLDYSLSFDNSSFGEFKSTRGTQQLGGRKSRESLN